jgi:hypothetical protein
MGNQMFIYACARSLSARLNIPYALSDLHHLRFFELSAGERNRNRFRYQRFRLFNRIPGLGYRFHHFQDNRTDYSNSMLKLQGAHHWFYGYFQGERYFFGREEDIAACFSIKRTYKELFGKAIDRLGIVKPLLTVHIRLKDYRTFGPDYLGGPDLSLPWSYYHKLLDRYDLNRYQVIFLSDEPDAIAKVFGDVPGAIFSKEDPIVDFQFIQHAHVCINAHSTFSWWAAWLNKVPGKKVHVPRNFLGFKVGQTYPVHIVPDAWFEEEVAL